MNCPRAKLEAPSPFEDMDGCWHGVGADAVFVPERGWVRSCVCGREFVSTRGWQHVPALYDHLAIQPRKREGLTPEKVGR